MRIFEVLNKHLPTEGTNKWIVEPESKLDPLIRRNRSFEIFSQLTGIKVNPAEEGGHSLLLKSKSIQMNLLHQPFGSNVWKQLPIQSHQVDEDSLSRADLVVEAFGEIERLFPSCIETFENMAYNLVFVRLGPNSEGDSQITSASFPSLPFTVFVSDKAFFHIPPNTVSQQPSVYAFVENIIHEVIHQAVNLSMFDGSVFPENFDASIAPKIEIPWRTSSGARNRAWELDRVWHAYCVYIGLKEVRECLLAQDELLTPAERMNISCALNDALISMNYLEQQLVDKIDYFSKKGARTLFELIDAKGVRNEISA